MGILGRVEQKEFEAYKREVNEIFEVLKEKLRLQELSNAQAFDALHSEIKATASVSDEIAKQAAASAIQSQANIKDIENSFTDALDELNNFKVEAQKIADEISETSVRMRTEETAIESLSTRAHDRLSQLENKKLAVESIYEDILEKSTEFNSYLEQSKDLPASLESTKELMAHCKKLADSMQSLLNHSIKRKSDIDELYTEVYGEDITNSDGETEHTAGKKDELDDAYIDLKKDIAELKTAAKKSVEHVTGEFKLLNEKNLLEFSKLLTDSNTRFRAVDEQLTGLLPGAMAAGLSAAYEEKKTDEIEALQSFDKAFRWAIGAMVLISCIPLSIDVFLVFGKNVDLVKVLKDTPTLLFAILPLYFPVLWMAYSSNKKSNLSKRLIEEYTHKSVLGKTYSGLSNQIENLKQSGDVKDELRTKLLFNVLQVSAENPGKLITNYNKSDHPLMDALENSAKLADSISALAKIPGFSAIATKLASKADNLLEENTRKVKRGMDVQTALESKSHEDSNEEESGKEDQRQTTIHSVN